jgi:Arc/MetJ family transcription regulator
MKLTLNIDDALLTRVMETTGAKTKTDAIHAALAEVDRRNKLVALLAEGVGPIDWDNAIDEKSWADHGRTSNVAETPTSAPLKTKAAPTPRDRKSRPRR